MSSSQHDWSFGHVGERISSLRRGQMIEVVLQRAPVNALDQLMYAEIAECFDHLNRSTSLSAILLRSNQRVFCAGQDRNEADLLAADQAGYLLAAGEAILSVTNCQVPIVAEVHGAAIGAGLILAASADVLVVSDDAHLTLPEIAYGVVAGYAHLAPIIGSSAARAAVLTGDPIAIADLDCYVLPASDVHDFAHGITQRIAKHSPDIARLSRASWAADKTDIARRYREELHLTLTGGQLDFTSPPPTAEQPHA